MREITTPTLVRIICRTQFGGTTTPVAGFTVFSRKTVRQYLKFLNDVGILVDRIAGPDVIAAVSTVDIVDLCERVRPEPPCCRRD